MARHGSGRAFRCALVGAALLGLCACGGGVDVDGQANDDDDQAAVAEEQRDEDRDQLAFSISCAVALDAVATLPQAQLQSDEVGESDDPAEMSAEHAGLGRAYRAQASTLAASLGIGSAEFEKRFAVERDRIATERTNRSPEDFVPWIGGEADSCPAI